MDLIIRNENANDYRIVEELTREAFWNLHTPGCDEHFILHNLRNSKDFIPELTFIAQNAKKIVGHIAYSHGVVRDETGAENEIISFGPLSVLPDYQKQGVGSTLIRHTANLARDIGYSAICIYGDPRYYSRFGFRCAEKYGIKTADDKFAVALQVLELKEGALRDISGKFIESHAFEVDAKKFGEFEHSFPFKEKTETESQREFRLLASLRY
jgi:putative acetyltransferase